MKLTIQERLILLNQYGILKKGADKYDLEYYEKCIAILENGFEHEYDSLTGHIDPDGFSKDDSSFVYEIMRIYSDLQFAVREGKFKLSKDEKHLLKFPGFDGNNEGGHLRFARYIREQGQAYESLDMWHTDYNSHCPTLDRYSRMIEAARGCQANVGGDYGVVLDPKKLMEEDVITILASRD